jgi:hypothetical protein
MDIPTHAQLLERIDAFVARHAERRPRVSERQIGVAITNEPGLIGSIRWGRSPSLDTLNKLARYMEAEDAKLGAATSAEAPTSAEWPLPSATKEGENIHNPDDEPDNGSIAA